jgi:hypothetical protein
MAYKYRVNFTTGANDPKTGAEYWLEFDSHFIDAGVIRNFEQRDPIDIYKSGTLFDKIASAHVISVDLNYELPGCDLRTTSFLTALKDDQTMSTSLNIELGHDDQKDILISFKAHPAKVSDIFLTHSGAVAVFGFGGSEVNERS